MPKAWLSLLLEHIRWQWPHTLADGYIFNFFYWSSSQMVMTEVMTSCTWASVANSCWCCRVRTIISPQKAIVAASHHQLKSYRWNSWWSFVVFLHPSGQSQNDVQVYQDPKSLAKRWARHIYFPYLRNSLGMIHLAFELAVGIQHDTWWWGHFEH